MSSSCVVPCSAQEAVKEAGAGGSPVHKHCPHPCSWLLQQQALAAEIMRKMLTPVARLVAVTLASLVSTASAEGSTIVAGSKGITTNYSHVIHYIVFQLSSLNLDINLTSSGQKKTKTCSFIHLPNIPADRPGGFIQFLWGQSILNFVSAKTSQRAQAATVSVSLSISEYLG